MEEIGCRLEENRKALCNALGQKENPQIKLTPFSSAGKNCCLIFMDGLVDHYRLTLMQINNTDIKDCIFDTVLEFAKSVFANSDYTTEKNIEKLATAVFKGTAVLLVDTYDQALLIDAKKPPGRGIEEPDKSKTLRGSHEGFCENLMLNLALIRRRIRSPRLRMCNYTIGKETQTDVALLYFHGKAEKKTVDQIRKRLESIRLNAVCMAQETIAEHLFPGLARRLNPFPKIRFTERPDSACAMLLEGKILILCDTSPSAIVLPVSLFDFFEETDDYYFPIPTGSYMRLIRFFVFIATIYLAPFWLLATKNTDVLPSLFHFVGKIEDEFTLPIFLQLLIIEFAIDGLKLASLNTPSPLSNSLSIVGGLLLGDYAVKSGWFIPQTILYSAFTAMANFVPSNLELGYCFKFQRMILIALTELFGLAGILGGSLFFLIVLAFTKSLDGKSYLYPLFPFDKKALTKIFFRTSTGREDE